MISRSLIALAGAALALGFSSCTTSTSVVSLDYVPSGQIVRGAPEFAVGQFKDKRGMNPQVLGQVRLPVGPAVDTVQTRLPVSDIVRNAFAHGLEARGMLSQTPRPRYLLRGDIQDLRVQLLVHPYGYARIRVNVVDQASGGVVYSRVYEAERQSNAYRPGSGSPVPMLRELTSRALQEAVDRALDDPQMRARLGSGNDEGGRPRYAPGML
ncbi:MAG TPA: hypothetical protein VGE39_24930 [Prosthecobacter sp.]